MSSHHAACAVPKNGGMSDGSGSTIGNLCRRIFAATRETRGPLSRVRFKAIRLSPEEAMGRGPKRKGGFAAGSLVHIIPSSPSRLMYCHCFLFVLLDRSYGIEFVPSLTSPAPDFVKCASLLCHPDPIAGCEKSRRGSARHTMLMLLVILVEEVPAISA